MRKIYEAEGEEKLSIIKTENDILSFDIQHSDYYRNLIGVKDIVLIGRINEFPIKNSVDTIWTLNGLPIDAKKDEGEILVIEPLIEQINNAVILYLNESRTIFDGPIELSDRAIIFMPLKKYDELGKNEVIKNKMENMDVRLYEGKEEFALRMLLADKRYIYIDVTKNGFLEDKENHPDLIEYERNLSNKIKELNEQLKINGKIEKLIIEKPTITGYRGYKENSTCENYKMITGLTKKVEGNIELGNNLFATTSIGKARDNQEDAVLLIKHKDNSKFKMMVLADGMGGWERGEIASDVVVTELKEWFDNLSPEQMKCYYTGVEGLKEELQDKIERELQIKVEYNTGCLGGTTIVCAIIGEKDTLIANVGDSRAYIIRDGKLEQLSREDTEAQRNLEKGKTKTKEEARFDSKSNMLLQAVGMPRQELQHPNIRIIDNSEYDMLLLFSDGVTDCLSDEDIAVVCKNTKKKDLTKKIVEKAIKHDSILPEELLEKYWDLNSYIPGGKDNTTAVVGEPDRD